VCTTLARSLAARSLAAGIGDGATRISDIVAALRSYSYLDRGTRQSVDVTEGLESTLVLLRAKLAGMHVERDYQPDLPSVWVNGSALNQVWTNIIDNAIDATGGSGRIILRTRHSGDAAGDGCLVVEIEDDGPGMPPDVVAQVFDPFFTTKEPGKGTGLGMNISHNIVVAEHNGTIAVESRPGRTCFRVEVPLAPTGDATS
jgi:signal transduction histidine kinase